MSGKADAWGGVHPPLTVMPRQRGYVHMEIAVVHAGRHIDQDTGEIFDGVHYLLTEHGTRKGNIPRYVQVAPPTVFVTLDTSSFLAQLDDEFGNDPTWHYTLTRVTNEIGSMGISRVKLRTFGFRGEGIRKQRLHQCWDPGTISPQPLHKYLDEATHESLLAWALDVRSWAADNDLELRNAFAGYGAQLLRDPRFYPEPRRKVPRVSNEKARPSLPGNLIAIYVTPGVDTYNVTAIDQRQAHHRIVQSTPLPDGDTLFARGYYGDPENAPDYWAKPGTELYERTIREPGLVCVGMHSRRTLKGEFRFPVQDYQGYRKVYAWTNTLSYMVATGTLIEGIYAAWTSVSTDTGLSRYGAWAQNQLANASNERRRWLKPLLHSTYGLLAARSRPLDVGHRQAKGGTRTDFLLGARPFTVRCARLPDWQPNTVNVIQRGVIEAETQLRTLQMARTLHAAGCHVLHLHTDGIHFTGQPPLIPDDWSVIELNRVTYIDRVSWVADEKVCLPGRDHQQRQELIEHYGDLHRTLGEVRKSGGLRWPVRAPTSKPDVQEGGPDVTVEWHGPYRLVRRWARSRRRERDANHS